MFVNNDLEIEGSNLGLACALKIKSLICHDSGQVSLSKNKPGLGYIGSPPCTNFTWQTITQVNSRYMVK